MARTLLTIPEVQRRLRVGHSKLYQDFINTGRLRVLRLGERAVRIDEADLDRLIDEFPAREPFTATS
jgi:excisionase family DNA binding protein